jgi:hypothetical protein
MPIVHTTGLTDDFGTPDDPSDDQPQLELTYITFATHCQSPPGPLLNIAGNLDLIAVAEGDSFTVHFGLSNSGEGALTYSVIGNGMINSSRSGDLGAGEEDIVTLSGKCPTHGDTTTPRIAQATISSDAPLFNHTGLLGFHVYCFPPDPIPYFLEPFFGYLYNTFSIELHNAGGQYIYRYSTPMQVQLTSDGVNTIQGQFATLTPRTDAAQFSQDGYSWTFDGKLEATESHTFRFDITCEVRGHATLRISAYRLDYSKSVSKAYGITCDPSKPSGTPGEVVPIGSP